MNHAARKTGRASGQARGARSTPTPAFPFTKRSGSLPGCGRNPFRTAARELARLCGLQARPTVKRRRARAALIAAIVFSTAALSLSSCATNPVTGKTELHLYSESWERQIGDTQYLPTQQIEGGRYVVDADLQSYVNRVGKKIAAVSDRPDLAYEFVVLNSSVPNAWALPGGKIAINRGLLLELDSEAELAAVLSHEIVHAAARHGAQRAERGLLMQTATLATGIALRDKSYGNLAIGAATLGAGLATARYSRAAELEADSYGMRYASKAGYDPRAAIKVQETFVRLAEDGRQDWLSGLFASHPPSQERVEANRRSAETLLSGGIVGAGEYRIRTARLWKSREAYEAADEARKAFANSDLTEASRLAEKALRKEPAEALFYSLRADILAERGREREALAQYDEALRRNDEYFEFYLRRGLLLKKLGRSEEARRDIETSVKMLPTSIAHAALGDLARASGDRRAAIAHYSQAAATSSQSGRYAAAALARLDMNARPGRYIEAGAFRNYRGELVVRVRNASPVEARRVSVLLTVSRPSTGMTRQRRIIVPGTLRPGESATVSSRMGHLDERDGKLRYRVEVLGAEPR